MLCFAVAFQTGVGTCSMSPEVFKWLSGAVVVVTFTLAWFALIVVVVRSGCVLGAVCLFQK